MNVRACPLHYTPLNFASWYITQSIVLLWRSNCPKMLKFCRLERTLWRHKASGLLYRVAQKRVYIWSKLSITPRALDQMSQNFGSVYFSWMSYAMAINYEFWSENWAWPATPIFSKWAWRLHIWAKSRTYNYRGIMKISWDSKNHTRHNGPRPSVFRILRNRLNSYSSKSLKCVKSLENLTVFDSYNSKMQ